jgi:methionyl-tRNA formyltransferase
MLACRHAALRRRLYRILSSDRPSLRLGFAGTPEFAVAALDALAEAHDIRAVFTQPDRPSGRGQPLHSSPVKKRALERRLSVHQPASFKSAEVLQLVRDMQLDALVVVAYGLILPAAVLDSPRFGCINIHASLLPRWRGAAPIQRAIMAGDSVTGITTMRMEAGLDTGPMLEVRALDISSQDTAKTLHDRLATLGAELICSTLQRLQSDDIQATPQPLDGVSYAAKINKAEAQIDWQQDALQVSRRVRAFNPWPVAETRLRGAQLRIWEAELVDRQGEAAPGTVVAANADGIDVACGRGALRILRLQLAGRKPLPAREFIRGQAFDAVRLGAA